MFTPILENNNTFIATIVLCTLKKNVFFIIRKSKQMMGSLVKKFPLFMYMDVVATCLHASSHTNTIVTTTPFSVSRPLKYNGAMTTTSKLTIVIAINFSGMG